MRVQTAEMYGMRHAEATTASGYFDGHDYDLTTKGHDQAETAARDVALLGVKLVVSSPARRARQTAEHVMAHLSADSKLVIDERIRELDWGDRLADTRITDFFTEAEETRANHEGLSYRAMPESESVLEVAGRVLDAVIDYGDYRGGNIVMVTHGQTIKALPAAMTDVSRQEYIKHKFPNVGVTYYDFDNPVLPVPLFDTPTSTRRTIGNVLIPVR